MSYTITRNYIRKGNARSGQKIHKVRFIVAHDTGNPGSTAHNNRSYFHNQQPLASAHTFIDDKYILEIVPLTEKAWHVIYNVTTDNKMFGANANDSAIGVELCYGGRINFEEAYKRYVWYMAYLCKKFQLDPRKHIVAHSTLDPGRKTDPDKNSFRMYGITWKQFINDVVREFQGGLTVEQYNELKKENKELKGIVSDLVQEVKTLHAKLENKIDKRPQGDTPSKSHEKNWMLLKEKNVTTGVRPKDYITREQTGTLIVESLKKFNVIEE